MVEFVSFGKISRIFRDCVITEKIDGTNAQIMFSDDMSPFELGSGRSVPFMVGSRSRWILPENDNAGFARWAYANAEELAKLGPGRHFGEWWGQGIQRAYGMKRKIFSLFNVGRWTPENVPSCCSVVPVLYDGPFTTDVVKEQIERLRINGSFAAPGFADPEGVVVFHKPGGYLFKATIKDDEKGKGS